MKKNTFSAFAVPGLTAAIVSGVMTTVILSFAQDIVPNGETWNKPVDSMQLRPENNEFQPRPVQMDGGMQGAPFKGSGFEMPRETNGSPDIQRGPGTNMNSGMNMAPMQGGQENFGSPTPSFGQGMQMNQGADRSAMMAQRKKQVGKEIKKMEKMKGKVEKQFVKQIARMQKKCDRALQKMQSRLPKLEEDDRADLQEEIDRIKSECGDMAQELNDQKEERLEDIDFRIEDLRDQLVDMESEDMDE